MLVLLVVFVAGFSAGLAWTRFKPDGLSVNVRMTSRLPRELTALGLSSSQEDTLQSIIRSGQQRTRAVLDEFGPRIKSVVDSVDAAVRTVLTPAQRTQFESARLKRTDDRIEIDTVVRN